MMRTGVSGMNAQSTRLATVADNIANSGTNGYKKAGVEFSSLLVPNSGTSYVSGGTAVQIRHSMTPGNLQYTTSITDLAIDGNGFMVVQDPAGKMLLTRSGSFIPDGNGNLLNAAGYYLMGRSFELGEPGTTTTFGDYEKVTIPTTGLERVPSTSGALASNLPFDAPVHTGLLPSDNPSTDIEIRQGMDNGSIFKTGLTAIGNAGEPIRLDIYFARTGARGDIEVNPNDPVVGAYSVPSTAIPDAPVTNPNNVAVSAYSAPTEAVADGAPHEFNFPGFTGHSWSTGDSVSYNVDIDGVIINVTGEFDGTDWSFATANPADVPANVTISYAINGADLRVNVNNATGSDIDVAVNDFSSYTFNDDHDFGFVGFTGLAWEEDDTVSFVVEIEGVEHDVTGVFVGGAWTFALDDPAALPTGATVNFDTSGADLVVNVGNTSGAPIDAEIKGFTSTRVATADKWEMTVFHQPNAAAMTAFPYTPGPLDSVTLEFDPSTGNLRDGTGSSVVLDLTALNGRQVEVDLSDMRQLATGYMPLTAEMNGSRPSPIDRVVIDNDGIVSVQYANGAMKKLYRLDLAFVQSPDQLTVLPGNVFQEGLNSGQVNFGKPNEISLGGIKSGALEASNVDIAEELTNMIESQRNYTANSKIFQTGGDLMDVLVNLKR